MDYSRDGRVWTSAPAACLPRDICYGNGTCHNAFIVRWRSHEAMSWCRQAQFPGTVSG